MNPPSLSTWKNLGLATVTTVSTITTLLTDSHLLECSEFCVCCLPSPVILISLRVQNSVCAVFLLEWFSSPWEFENSMCYLPSPVILISLSIQNSVCYLPSPVILMFSLRVQNSVCYLLPSPVILITLGFRILNAIFFSSDWFSRLATTPTLSPPPPPPPPSSTTWSCGWSLLLLLLLLLSRNSWSLLLSCETNTNPKVNFCCGGRNESHAHIQGEKTTPKKKNPFTTTFLYMSLKTSLIMIHLWR